jgi:hypothetical protein
LISFYLKELSTPGKITVFSFVLCPHTTPPLDLLPWKMKKNQVYKLLQVTLCLFFLLVVHLEFPSYFFWVFVSARRSTGPLIANFLPVWTPYTTYMPSTPYMHTIKHIHCHCKQRDVKRRHRESVVPAPGTAAEQRPSYDAVDDDDGSFVSKMKAATFQRRPPRIHGQCTHTLGTKDEENNNLQITLLDFVTSFCLFCVFGL